MSSIPVRKRILIGRNALEQEIIDIFDLGSKHNTVVALAVREIGASGEISPHDISGKEFACTWECAGNGVKQFPEQLADGTPGLA